MQGNRKTKTARIAMRAVSFAGGVGLEPKTHRAHCASYRAGYLADVTRRNVIWGSACGVSRLPRLAPSLWCSDENAREAIFSDGCAAGPSDREAVSLGHLETALDFEVRKVSEGSDDLQNSAPAPGTACLPRTVGGRPRRPDGFWARSGRRSRRRAGSGRPRRHGRSVSWAKFSSASASCGVSDLRGEEFEETVRSARASGGNEVGGV